MGFLGFPHNACKRDVPDWRYLETLKGKFFEYTGLRDDWVMGLGLKAREGIGSCRRGPVTLTIEIAIGSRPRTS